MKLIQALSVRPGRRPRTPMPHRDRRRGRTRIATALRDGGSSQRIISGEACIFASPLNAVRRPDVPVRSSVGYRTQERTIDALVTAYTNKNRGGGSGRFYKSRTGFNEPRARTCAELPAREPEDEFTRLAILRRVFQRRRSGR